MDLSEARKEVVSNLRSITDSLKECVDEGMIDPHSEYYNQLVSLIEEAQHAEDWNELLEIISRGQTLETDVAAWLSNHGVTTISLEWPASPKGE